jgi:hypothetical protein
MTHNIDGDGDDVWPWLGSTAIDAKLNDNRFDIAKLDGWLTIFEYMQTKGIAVYIILEDDSCWTGYDHARYYRELVARFGHLPALLFNLGEEYDEANNWSDVTFWAEALTAIDPYDHPIAVHGAHSSTNYVYETNLSFTSLQTSYSDGTEHNADVIDWINSCKNLNQRILVVNIDEGRPILKRKSWWSAYMGGGVWEAHVSKPYDRPMSTWEKTWHELGGARSFMETLPFWEMEPSNHLVVSGSAFCLAKEGECYALYLPSGGTVRVNLSAGTQYSYGWWNPANGIDGSFQDEGVVNGGGQEFVAPGSGDWVLRISAE